MKVLGAIAVACGCVSAYFLAAETRRCPSSQALTPEEQAKILRRLWTPEMGRERYLASLGAIRSVRSTEEFDALADKIVELYLLWDDSAFPDDAGHRGRTLERSYRVMTLLDECRDSLCNEKIREGTVQKLIRCGIDEQNGIDDPIEFGTR